MAADSDLETLAHVLIEAQLANCLNLNDPRDQGIEFMNIFISQKLSRAHFVLLADVLPSCRTEFPQSDKSLCAFIYSAFIPIDYFAIRSAKIGLY